MKNWLRALSLVVAASLGAFGLQQLSPYARAAMYQWSTTAATNATADPTINWSEGMSPSSVNDSARAMMAVLAQWRNDVGAITATTGTSTAYVLTSNQGSFSAASTRDGFLIGFIPNVTNAAGGVTINVDGAGAKPLRTATGTAIAAGALVAGSKYHAAYKFSTDEWLLFNSFPSQFEVPLGAIIPFTGTTAPNANFVIPTGQCISRTTYATYFAMVGTTFGACDGVLNFGVPDLRGRGLWGTDTLQGAAAGRLNATGCTTTSFGNIGDVCGAQTRQIGASNVPSLVVTGGSVSSGVFNFAVFDRNVTNVTTAVGTMVTMGSSFDGGTNTIALTGSPVANSGSPNTAMQFAPPVMGLNMLLRVL